MAYGTYPE